MEPLNLNRVNVFLLDETIKRIVKERFGIDDVSIQYCHQPYKRSPFLSVYLEEINYGMLLPIEYISGKFVVQDFKVSKRQREEFEFWNSVMEEYNKGL